MAVYLNSATLQAGTRQTRRALQLGQAVDLPYFNAFSSALLTLTDLYQLLDQHIQQAYQQAGWAIEDTGSIPIFLGSTGYVLADCEARLMHNQPLPTEYSIAVIGDYLQQRYGSPVYSFATSCTSSAHAIHYAYKMLNTAQCQKALVIGVESFNRLTFEHFYAMHLLSQSADYRPFHQSTGIVLGEGLACLALSNQPSAEFNYELQAMQSLTDAESLTNNSPDALEQLIFKILEKGKISPTDIVGVKPHAVGGNFDHAEMAILTRHFPHLSHDRWILPKTNLGHTLGASGAVETAFLLQQLQKSSQNPPLATQNLPKTVAHGYYLNYFLGFGGSNIGWLVKWGHH